MSTDSKPVQLACGCKAWLTDGGEVEMRIAGCQQALDLKCDAIAFDDEGAPYDAFRAHFDAQLAAARASEEKR